MADFFRKNGQASEAEAPARAGSSHVDAVREAPTGKPDVTNAVLLKHWNAIKADGISASRFIAFLQPLANLDGIAVSYTYFDDDGHEHTYNRRRDDLSSENPLSKDIRAGRLSKEKALTFALNEEGRVWIETNFHELK
ncbi:hypothetical protein [Variovorax sp. HW608]|uniref:hypothetical protein n=1 Tax=Variovorax sp. HW608 TaxID=1034889 RepID=UPI000B5AD977|nr:hypothetical protein [Variovorax sp. HW608]